MLLEPLPLAPLPVLRPLVIRLIARLYVLTMDPDHEDCGAAGQPGETGGGWRCASARQAMATPPSVDLLGEDVRVLSMSCGAAG